MLVDMMEWTTYQLVAVTGAMRGAETIGGLKSLSFRLFLSFYLFYSTLDIPIFTPQAIAGCY